MNFAGDTLTVNGWALGSGLAVATWLAAFLSHWASKSILVDEVVDRVTVEDVHGTMDQVKVEQVAESSADASTLAEKAEKASQMTHEEFKAQKKKKKKEKKQRKRAEAKIHAAGMYAVLQCFYSTQHCMFAVSCKQVVCHVSLQYARNLDTWLDCLAVTIKQPICISCLAACCMSWCLCRSYDNYTLRGESQADGQADCMALLESVGLLAGPQYWPKR